MLLGALIEILAALSAAVLNNPTKHRMASTPRGGAMDLPYGHGKDRSGCQSRCRSRWHLPRPGQTADSSASSRVAYASRGSRVGMTRVRAVLSRGSRAVVTLCVQV